MKEKLTEKLKIESVITDQTSRRNLEIKDLRNCFTNLRTLASYITFNIERYQGKGIVYVNTRKETVEVANAICECQ